MYSLPLSCGYRSLQAPSQFLPFLPLDLPILGPMAGGMNAESCGPQFNLELSREEVSLSVDNWSQLLKAAAGSVKVGPSLTSYVYLATLRSGVVEALFKLTPP